MAEAFANRYGGDVLVASSSGLAPAQMVARGTVQAMRELDVDVSAHTPRLYNPVQAAQCDLVINISGINLPGLRPKEVVTWQVDDPIGDPIETFRIVRAELEQRVMRLILDLRRRAKQ